MDRAEVTRRAVRGALASLAAFGFSFPAGAATETPQLTIKAGTPQTAQAWVAARADRYETHFEHALVVVVSPAKTKVRFRCITPGCEFPASDQPDTVSRVDPSAYDVAAVKGEALRFLGYSDGCDEGGSGKAAYGSEASARDHALVLA